MIDIKHILYLGVIASLLATTGCSLRYDFTECSSDADCLKIEGSGEFYTCDTANNQCVSASIECRADTDCAGKGDRTKCQANACVNPTPMGDMGPDEGVDMPPDMGSGCKVNSECTTDQTPNHLCGADGQCFDPLNADCTEFIPPKTGGLDKMVVVGVIMPLVEPFGTVLGKPLANAVKLAQDQFNGEGALADGRKIGLLICDSKGNATVGSRAASHLASKVGVPAIIGPLFSEVFIAAASDVARPNNTFIISPTATSPAITNLHTPQSNTIWRNIASDEFQGAAFVQRVKDIGVQRVLILYKDDKYGDDLRMQMELKLRTDLGETNVKVVQYDNPITIPDTIMRRQQYGMIIGQALADFEPQAVLILGTNEGAEVGGAYLTIVGSMMKTPGKMIFSHGVVPALAEFVNSIPNGQNFLPLIEAIAPDIFNPKDQSYKSFLLSYNLAFGGTQSSIPATTSFDAAMTTFLAMSALPSGDVVTGKKIANNIGRLVDKSAAGVEVRFFDTSYVSKATNALSEGKGIDMVGVSGALDYDTTTGSVYTRQIGWEVIPDVTNGYTIKQKREMLFPNAPMTTGTWTDLPE